MSELPFSPSSERNKRPILGRLQQVLPRTGRLLEIGAGTGQHAVCFASRFRGLEWQASERAGTIEGLRRRIDAEGPPGMPPPVELDVLSGPWPEGPFQAAFSANTAHIMPWPAVCAMFSGLASVLASGGLFCLYGPFSDSKGVTAPSNRAFDLDLRARDPSMGLRDLAEIDDQAAAHRFVSEHVFEMPANNLLLVFRRLADTP